MDSNTADTTDVEIADEVETVEVEAVESTAGEPKDEFKALMSTSCFRR